jgi:hypothetical protein
MKDKFSISKRRILRLLTSDFLWEEVVFPRVKKSVYDGEVQRIWTDDIVLPSIKRHLSYSSDYPSSYLMPRLNSQAAGNTPAFYYLQQLQLKRIWADIVEKTQQEEFQEFRGAFLVALGQWEPALTRGKSIEGTWKSLTCVWNLGMDMEYIPAETLEVLMESEFSLSG